MCLPSPCVVLAVPTVRQGRLARKATEQTPGLSAWRTLSQTHEEGKAKGVLKGGVEQAGRGEGSGEEEEEHWHGG